MAESRRREMWRHTSSLLAMLANCHRDPRKSAVRASDLDPFEQRAQCKVISKTENKMGVDVLKEAFFSGKGKRQCS